MLVPSLPTSLCARPRWVHVDDQVVSLPAGRCVLALMLIAFVSGTGATRTEDPLFASQWHHEQVGSLEAWEVTRGAGQTIAILDFGIDLDHPDLAVNLRGGVSDPGAGTGTGSYEEINRIKGHGTSVASIAAAAANGYGGVGVAPEAGILSVGWRGGRDLRDGIAWAARRGAGVVNISVGELPAGQGVARQWREDIVDVLVDVVVIVAAGNASVADAICAYPHPRILCVTATDRQQFPAPYSGLGFGSGSVAVAAPGGSVDGVSWYSDALGTCPAEMVVAKPLGMGEAQDSACPISTQDAGYGLGVGTSFAAPVVSGVAALVRSLGCDAVTTVEIITSTARIPVDVAEGLWPYYGHGIVDAAAAVDAGRRRCSP